MEEWNRFLNQKRKRKLVTKKKRKEKIKILTEEQNRFLNQKEKKIGRQRSGKGRKRLKF